MSRFCLLIIMVLAGCSRASDAELRDQIEQLEARIAELESATAEALTVTAETVQIHKAALNMHDGQLQGFARWHRDWEGTLGAMTDLSAQVAELERRFEAVNGTIGTNNRAVHGLEARTHSLQQQIERLVRWAEAWPVYKAAPGPLREQVDQLIEWAEAIDPNKAMAARIQRVEPKPAERIKRVDRGRPLNQGSGLQRTDRPR